MEFISRAVFGLAAAVLMLIALALSIYSAALIVNALRGPWGEAGSALLESIGYVVIAVAVFDVAKYFIEEEVIRGREMRLASEARRSLTKFVSTIAIAVFIEGLVMVFRQGGQDIALVLYPAVILFTGILIILGLGLYQRLSADVEQQVEARTGWTRRGERPEEEIAAHTVPNRAAGLRRNVTLRLVLLRRGGGSAAAQYDRYQSADLTTSRQYAIGADYGRWEV